jgi:hypothetical protein
MGRNATGAAHTASYEFATVVSRLASSHLNHPGVCERPAVCTTIERAKRCEEEEDHG